MVKKENILKIAKYHINKVYNFNPYHKFEGVNNAEQFCNLIADDPAFKFFGLDDRRYVTARMGGNLITSLHRKLGDMYQEIFQYLLKEKFNLTDDELHFSVDVKIGGRIQKRSTDGLIPANRYGDIELPSSLENWRTSEGIGLEVRSCYQIGDSKRIQADWDMALALSQKNLIPVMLIFCNTNSLLYFFK